MQGRAHEKLPGDRWRRAHRGGGRCFPLHVSRFMIPLVGRRIHGAGIMNPDSGLVFKTGFSNRDRSTRYLILSINN